MSFVEEIYAMYRHHLKGNEEDVVALVLNLLHDHHKSDILEKIKEMEDYEVFQMFAMYLIEALKVRMAEEEMRSSEVDSRTLNPKYH
ncbi:hypothetical protein BHF71_02060 [Vulcanibacillus modesticaldus]|uniref:Cytosolic protein n=1 Tax=Vulcanibacillus modesticaldus TaxID=337097 RepID=A0A1D2YUK5_9BACI|nr:DUF6154 family protein [Vulcanibacillus modesticaldus]OEF99392.1 hypothetical protein BHF71_02060 [Vulcanibacillus modesticaldus]